MNTFLIVLIAGLSTMIGTLVIFFDIDKDKIINYSLSFSSGVLLSISIFDLLFESIKMFNKNYRIIISIIIFTLFFLVGLLITFFINKRIDKNDNIYKIGLLSLIGIMIHNIPEGMLTYISFKINSRLGINIAVAIAMHNIPEGISIAVPIFYSTNNKLKAIIYTLISSLSEPLGALISLIFLKYVINNTFLGILLSLVSGIMIYISYIEFKSSKTNILLFFTGIIFILLNLML
ncbi:MAG: ZIP family metal transporter [Bacilli bacterium]|nr:ZIP family metal transporter [Bacilli bacterium]